MVKMVVGEVETQTSELKTYCTTYTKALESVSTATEDIMLAVGMQGKGMDSIKSYLSSVYPALCRAVILHSEAIVTANETYLGAYTSKFGSKDLDSDELEERIRQAQQVIDNYETQKADLEFSKQNLSDDVGMVVLGFVYQKLIGIAGDAVIRNQERKAKLEKKLQEFLDFSNQSTTYFDGLTDSESLVTKGMQALGVNVDGSIGVGNWNGSGFSVGDDGWIKNVGESWSNRELTKKYDIDRPKGMTDEEYKNYLVTLRSHESELKNESWDQASINAYFVYVNTHVKGVPSDKIWETVNGIYTDVHKVGSEVYTLMFDAFGTVDGKIPKGKSEEINQKKLQMMLDQMGGYVDEFGMLQLKDGKYAFDSDMPPHGDFLKCLSSAVQKAFPDKNLKEYGELGQKVSHFRIYLDKHNIDYLREKYKDEKDDYDRLKKYAEEFDIPLDYSTGASLHNRSMGDFSYGKNMKVLAPKNYDKNEKYPGARMSEYIIDVETGNFVSQWDVYKKNPDGTYDFNPAHYTASECADLANTESFNYGPSKGENNDRPKGDNNSHNRLDVKRPKDTPVREDILKKWNAEKDVLDREYPGNYVDIVKVGEADVETWNKVPKQDREKVYNEFMKDCEKNDKNSGFASYWNK